ncbi:MAG: Coenzyme A biosynthesis bifunctional protein CoaBC [Chloroflexi bacterium ADurb.Bin325]|nr:MAG: Coenzyme A biosynthesis bifunctional protein CoaBC [Chloroflexi bacterium ADurb.Bin325]
MADRLLDGQRVLLGVTGGIAAYKAADLCSKLVQAGAQVDVVMTEAAARFVAPLTFAALSGRPARIDMWSAPGGDPIPHVRMAASTDLVIVAPLSANTLAKLALGLADNLLTATLLATPIAALSKPGFDGGVPWILAPAMESHMWANPLTQAHMVALVARGAAQVGPGRGRLASGAMGAGRMAEPAEILAAARLALARRGPLAGRRVLVTAGGTQEPLDPVRYLTNASSGKMGLALAEAARDLGAAVAVVHAPLAVPMPYGVESVPVRTAQQMCDAVLARAGTTDVLIGAAAVADFRPAEAAGQKIKKTPGQEELLVRLARNPDILGEVAAQRAQTGWPRAVVGFAAETQDLLANAAAKLVAKRLDLIVANDVTEPGSGFGADDNRVTLLFADGRQEALPIMPKAEVADRVLAAVLPLLQPD